MYICVYIIYIIYIYICKCRIVFACFNVQNSENNIPPGLKNRCTDSERSWPHFSTVKATGHRIDHHFRSKKIGMINFDSTCLPFWGQIAFTFHQWWERISPCGVVGFLGLRLFPWPFFWGSKLIYLGSSRSIVLMHFLQWLDVHQSGGVV